MPIGCAAEIADCVFDESRRIGHARGPVFPRLPRLQDRLHPTAQGFRFILRSRAAKRGSVRIGARKP